MRYLCSNLFELSTLTKALAPIEALLVNETMQCQRSPLHAFVFSLKPILSPKRISVLLLILQCSTFATQRNSHKSRNYDNDMRYQQDHLKRRAATFSDEIDNHAILKK